MVEHDSWKDYTLNVMNVRLIGDDFLKSNPTFVWLCQQIQENANLNSCWINFEIAAAIVLGENIGTTITAWLASIGANLSAKRAARAHFIFNITGVCWMLLLFYPFVTMLDNIMPGAIKIQDVTYSEATTYLLENEFKGEPKPLDIDKAKKAIVDKNIPLHLSLFHTLFNLINIGLLIGFSPKIAQIVERMVKSPAKEINST